MNTTRKPMQDRFWAKVDTSGDCWVWTGSTNDRGYGWISRPGKTAGSVLAHRYSAMLHFGMFDSRLCVLHRCDNPSCVRPDHLYLGDREQNAGDCTSKGRHPNQRKTACPQGHPYSTENTYINRRGGRCCRECSREALRRHRRKSHNPG